MLFLMTVDLPPPRLLGVRVKRSGPIEDAFLWLPEKGLTVLYGRNGAGKTHLLRAIESIWSSAPVEHPLGVPIKPVTRGREAELLFEWPLPEWLSAGRWPYRGLSEHTGGQREVLDRSDVMDWKALPGNPWYAVQQDLDYSINDTEYMETVLEQITELLHRVLPESNWSFEPGRRLARQIAVELSIEYCDDDESAARVAAVCDEIMGRARFCYANGASRPVVVEDPDSPLLQRLVQDIRDEACEDEDYWDAAQRLGLGHAGHLVVDQPSENEGGSVRRANALAPAWYGDDRVGFTRNPLRPTPPPAQLVNESSDDLAERTIRALEDRLRDASRHEEDDGERGNLLSERADGSVILRPELLSITEAVAGEATRFARLLLEGAPDLRCELSPPTEWYRRPPLRWVALDPTGTWVEFEFLSRAQRRWAELSVALALERRVGVPLVVLLDEPEAALHRRAERHLVRGLERLSQELNASVLVATHSPAFFEQSSAQLVHLYRDGRGRTALAEMPTVLRDRVDDLGLDPTDLLQLCRTVLLVEGQHELAVLGELIGDELRQAGALTFAMRGVTKLGSAADAQLLFTYTDATLLVVVDNDDADRVTDIWERACRAADDGDDPLPVLAEYTKHKRDYEQIALQEFCALAIASENRERIRFRTLSLPDVPEYLPVHAVAPGAPAGATWSELHTQHERTGKPGKRPRFKNWMTDTYGADYSESNLRAAARSMDSIPEELVEILQAVRQTSGTTTGHGIAALPES